MVHYKCFGLIRFTSVSAQKKLHRRSVTDFSPHQRTDSGSQRLVFSGGEQRSTCLNFSERATELALDAIVSNYYMISYITTLKVPHWSVSTLPIFANMYLFCVCAVFDSIMHVHCCTFFSYNYITTRVYYVRRGHLRELLRLYYV